MKIDRIRLDIDKKLAGVIPSVQWDNNTRYLHINVLNGTEAFNLNGYSVKVAGLKPDGTSFFNDVRIINAREGFIEVVLTEQMNAAAGSVKCELKLYNSRGVLSTQPFIIYVETSVTSKNIVSSNEFGALTAALNKVNNIDTKFESLTTETVTRATEREIQKQIQQGNIANLTIAPGSITQDKLSPNIKFGVEDGGVTSTKIADKAVMLRHVDFLKRNSVNPFNNSETLVGKKISHVGSGYVTENNDSYMISSSIQLLDMTNNLEIYVYDRIAFFGANGEYISALGRYNNDADKTNVVVRLSDYPVLATAKSIKVCIKKTHLSDMYIRQCGKNLAGDGVVTFDNLELTKKQITDVVKNIPAKSLALSTIKDIQTTTASGIKLEEGKKIAANGDAGYDSTRFNLVDKSDAATTVLIPINTNDNSTWEFVNVARVAFFGNGEVFMNTLYDSWNNSNPPSSVKLLEQFPVLRGVTGVRLSIKSANINNWSLKIDGVEYFKPGAGSSSYYIPDLIVKEKNLTESIQETLARINNIQLSAIQGVQTKDTPGLEIEEGKKIAANGDNGYMGGKFTLTNVEDAITTNFISINVDENSVWKFKNVGRLSFFDENETYIDSLYDEWRGSKAPSNIKMFETFPSLRNTKKVRLSIKAANKDDWSLIIDGVEYFQSTSSVTHHIKNLRIEDNNLSKELKTKLSKLDDNAFKNHKDTTIVFKKNKDFASTHFRIPFMCVTKNGTIIAGCDIRYNTWNDHSLIDLGTARSEDGGKTWIDKTVAIPNPGVSSTLSRVMDGTILATKEGRVFLIGNKFNTGSTGWTQVNTPNDPNWDCVMYKSDDDGRTWQFHQSLKNLLPQGQISFLGGVGSGIQMKDGTLVFPIQMARYNDKPFNAQSGIIYSKDNGATWKMSTTLIPEYTSECSIVEYPTGTIMINCRQEGQNHRSVFKTTNLGTTWEETPMNTGTQQTNTCQGHMCKIKVGFNKEVVLFTNPINDGSNRQDGAYAGYDRSNLSLSILQNDTKFTPIHTIYRPHSDGYSCMAFDERRNRLYVVMELEYNLVFRDLTALLPTIQLYKNLETPI